jgi:hypothetical protein
MTTAKIFENGVVNTRWADGTPGRTPPLTRTLWKHEDQCGAMALEIHSGTPQMVYYHTDGSKTIRYYPKADDQAIMTALRKLEDVIMSCTPHGKPEHCFA